MFKWFGNELLLLFMIEDCDILISGDSSVSRRHAVIRVSGSTEVRAVLCIILIAKYRNKFY